LKRAGATFNSSLAVSGVEIQIRTTRESDSIDLTAPLDRSWRAVRTIAMELL
jgi:hypothetical protein